MLPPPLLTFFIYVKCTDERGIVQDGKKMEGKLSRVEKKTRGNCPGWLKRWEGNVREVNIN